jgi:hypothetical protein
MGMRDLGDLSGISGYHYSEARSVHDVWQVVGESETERGVIHHAFKLLNNLCGFQTSDSKFSFAFPITFS